MRTWYVILIAVIALVIVGVVVWSIQKPQAEQQPAPPTTKEPTVPAAVTVSGTVLEVPVALTGQFFDPPAVTAHKGDTLKLTIRSIDASHAVYVPSTGQTVRLAQGQSQVVTLSDVQESVTLACTGGCTSDVRLAVTVQ